MRNTQIHNTMWIWVIIIFVIIGAVMGFAQSGKGEDAFGGAMTGGRLAVGCLGRLAIAALGILFILWLFSVMFR